MSSPNPTTQSSSPNTPQPPPQSIPKKIPPLPWTHLETVNLIESYQEKWYSLKRGQLKASQWEEVAGSVASRCGFKELSKTATQCRHKMEKLRKRYRGEKQRGVASVWNYFEMMDLMERGPFPISAARPVAAAPVSQSRQNQRRPVTNSNSSEEEEEEEEEDDEINKSRSINHILRRPPVASPIFDALPLPSKYGGIGSGGGGGSGVGNGSGPLGQGVSRFLRNPMFRKRKRSFEVNDMEEEEEEEGEEDGEGGGEGGRLLSELASVIRSFGEGFVKVENMKLEMMKETEMHRIEMEKKRMEMILESQRSIVDAIAKTFDSRNKSKKTRETLEE